MTAGESLAEHSAEMWVVLVSVITIFVSLLIYIYKGLVKRIDKIPENLVTREILDEYCKTKQTTCPTGNQMEQIAIDTGIIRKDLQRIMDKQEKLREETLPNDYLKIITYDKAHTKLEAALKESISEIKLLVGGMGTVSDIKIIFNEKIDEIRQAYNKK
jgi:hypothetical protein